VKEKWTFTCFGDFQNNISNVKFQFQINREKWHHLKLEDTNSFQMKYIKFY